jgi:DNA repair exonuclease SbcCD ATPase subunit
MKILNDLAQDINQDLSAILAHEDFVPYIKIEDDAIEFYFSRDNAEFNMAEGSGYEKTMLLLALHYLLLSKMVIPISNIFILDEVFVGVATGFLHRAYKVIESMLNMFDTILLITHVADIGEWCNDSIKVSKINNISKIVE